MPVPIRSFHLNELRGWRGGEQQVLTLLSGLRDRGHEAVLVAQPRSTLSEHAFAAGIEVLEVPSRGELSPQAVFTLRRRIAERRPDIVHCHTSHTHMHGVLACLGKPEPKLIVSRRVDFSIHKLPLRVALWKYRTRVDRYIAISEAVRRVMIADGVCPDRIDVVLSGLDPHRAEATKPLDFAGTFGIRPQGPVIVTVAALVGHKGHRFLVDAIPAVLQRHPSARFVFVGEGPLQEPLRQQARDRGVADAILFAGFREDYLAITAVCDLYVMPSHLEGLNTSVIDAIFLSRPSVVTDAGGLPELIEDGTTGRVAAKEDPVALAAAICDMLEAPDTAKTMAQAARAWALRHVTADCMVDGTLRTYARALGRDG